MLTFETKEDVFERIIALKKPKCKYCGQEMSLWEVPDINVSDGLGWGTPLLFVCFNDECSLYKGGWENLKENYGRTASYRCICYPGTETYECMSVWGPVGGHGQIIDDEVLTRQKRINEKTAKGMAALETYSQSKDSAAVLAVLTDANEPAGVRVKAADMLGEIGGTDCIDSLRNHVFGNETLRKKVEVCIEKIHQRHFTRECPFCAEIIKQQAKLCKHCGRESASDSSCRA